MAAEGKEESKPWVNFVGPGLIQLLQHRDSPKTCHENAYRRTNILLFYCPGVAKLPANAEHKVTKCYVSLCCPITMLLSYLLAQLPVGHWLEYLKSELSSLLGYTEKMLSHLPTAHINFAICTQSNSPPTPQRQFGVLLNCNYLPFMLL